MNQRREIKNFIHSQYFSDGLRITFGVLFPSLLLARFGLLGVGINVSLGALIVSIADNPGPVIHKRNGMIICLIFTFLTVILTGIINSNSWMLLIEIALFSFFFSMLTVYGARGSSIGTGTLLIMILTIDQHLSLADTLINSLYFLAGGIWYFLLSISLFQIRLYRMAQQTLGECIREVADYLRIKAGFYDIEKEYDETYRKLIEQQVTVAENQDAVREVLLKSRNIVKETTTTGRQLLLIFIDIVDLFEQTMATHYDYLKIRANFRKEVLKEFGNVITQVAEELDNMSLYITSNERPKPLHNFQPVLEQLKRSVDQVEANEGINNLVLKKILVNLRNIVNRIHKIYSYFDQKQFSTNQENVPELARFAPHQDYDLKILRENLTLNSSSFRHSLRVAIVMVTGFLVAKALPLGHHSYWILLTILVILKPAFSLTKKRNYQRVIGTLAGGITGALVVFYIKDQNIRFFLLILCMIGSYSFQRLNYVVSVLFTTPYVIIFYSFIGQATLGLARERMLDTFIGSLIAFTASYFVFPNWEYVQLKNYMRSTLIANYNYLAMVASNLSGKKINETEYKLLRKEVYVSSANLGASFQRMLSEPKRMQKNAKDIHKFVVLNHILSSYIVTLITGLRQNNALPVNQNHIRLIKRSLYLLYDSINHLETDEKGNFTETNIQVSDNLIKITEDSPDSKLIEEQLEFVNNTAADIQKIVCKLQH